MKEERMFGSTSRIVLPLLLVLAVSWLDPCLGVNATATATATSTATAISTAIFTSTSTKSHDYYDQLRRNNNNEENNNSTGTTTTNSAYSYTKQEGSNLLWIHNGNEIDSNENNQNNENNENDQSLRLRLGEITTFLPFSVNGESRTGVHDDAAVALLAMRHFNEMSSSSTSSSPVVRGVDHAANNNNNNNDNSMSNSNSNSSHCNVKLTLELLDTQFSPIESTRTLTQVLQRPHTLERPLPAAVVGAYRSATTSPLAILTGVHDIPQVSATSTSTDFDVKEQFPRFGRTISSSVGEAQAALSLFQSWNATHVGVLFVTFIRTTSHLSIYFFHLSSLSIQEAYGSALQKAFQDAATEVGIVTDSVAFSFSATGNTAEPSTAGTSSSSSPSPPAKSEIAHAVANLREMQYRMIYAICFETHYAEIMEAAHDEQIVGNDHVWIFPGLDAPTFYKTAVFPQSSPLALATPGVGLLQFAGGATADPWLPFQDRMPPLITNNEKLASSGFERFRSAWRDALQDEEWLDYVRSKFPKSLTDLNIEGWNPTEAFSPEPSTYSPFLYDAIFSLGLAMCRGGDGLVTGSEIYHEFRNLDFDGATGHVVMNNETGTRISHPFVLFNVLAYDEPEKNKEDDENENDENHNDGQARFAIYPSQVLENNGQWKTIREFQFAHGGTTPPGSLPPVDHDRNYIGTTGRAIGYTCMGIVMISAVTSWIWLARNAHERTIRSAQPTFLILVSVGSFVMASAIFPMGMEETVDMIDSVEGLNQACQAVPWLYITGAMIAFSALFAKTRAIYHAFVDSELDFIYVMTRDYLITFGVLLVVNLVVLVTWTVLAPLEWHRKYKQATDLFARPVESYGTCSNGDATPFVVVLLVVNLGILILANFWAYKARNIETEYHESRYIAISIASVLQAWCIGIPILIMVWDNPQANFFVGTGIVFVTSLAVLGLIFIPKVISVWQDRRLAAAEEKRLAYKSFAERKNVQQEEIYNSDEINSNKKEYASSKQNMLASAAAAIRMSEDEASEMRPSQMETEIQDHAVSGRRSTAVETAEDESSGGSETPRTPRTSLFRGGAMRLSESSRAIGGVRVLHNPKAERNLIMMQEREAQLVSNIHSMEDLNEDISLPVTNKDVSPNSTDNDKLLVASKRLPISGMESEVAST